MHPSMPGTFALGSYSCSGDHSLNYDLTDKIMSVFVCMYDVGVCVHFVC